MTSLVGLNDARIRGSQHTGLEQVGDSLCLLRHMIGTSELGHEIVMHPDLTIVWEFWNCG